jgi:hypothetical protein
MKEEFMGIDDRIFNEKIYSEKNIDKKSKVILKIKNDPLST